MQSRSMPWARSHSRGVAASSLMSSGAAAGAAAAGAAGETIFDAAEATPTAEAVESAGKPLYAVYPAAAIAMPVARDAKTVTVDMWSSFGSDGHRFARNAPASRRIVQGFRCDFF